MATFQTQVESIAGTVSSTSNLSIWLTDGVTDITRRLIMTKHADLPRLASSGHVSATTGMDLSNIVHIVSVTRGSYPAYEVPESMSWKVYQPDGIFKATARNPAYFKKNNYLYVAPVSSTSAYASYIPLHDVAYSDSEVPRFPNEYNYAVVLYAACGNLLYKISALSLPTDITLPTAPTMGALSTVTATIPTVGTITPITLPAPPADVTIDLSDVGTAPAFVSPTALSMPTLAAFGTAPVYTPPSPSNFATYMTTATGYIDTSEDIELAQQKLQQVGVELNKYQLDMQNAMSVFGDDNTEYQASIQRALQEYQTGAGNEINRYTAELGAAAKVLESDLAVWTSQIKKALDIFQTQSGYNMNMYKTIIDGQVSVYRANVEMEISRVRAEIDVYNADLNTTLETNKLVLGKYSTEVQAYQVLIAALIQDFTAKINKVQVNYTLLSEQWAKIRQQYEAIVPALTAPRGK